MLRTLTWAGFLAVLLAAGLFFQPESRADRSKIPLKTQLRRPVALAVVGDRLLVANRESGSLTVIERSSGNILAEHEIAGRIADMQRIPESGDLLVLDEGKSGLLKVTLQNEKPAVQVLAKTPFPGSKLAFDPQTRTIFVTAKWAHRVFAFRLDANCEKVVRTGAVKLPFAPQELLWLSGEKKLLAAEAFGGRLAVLDAEPLELKKIRRIEGHNIRGLAQSEDGRDILIAHQKMPEQALADYEEVHWGRMVDNAVQVIGAKALLEGEAGTPAQGWLDTHGSIGSAQGDPGGVLTGPGGFVAVAFSGVGEVTIRQPGYKKRLRVKTRPEAMAFADGQLYVANRFDDSISVIDAAEGEVTDTISLGPTPRLTSEQRGEMLFFDARLSHDGWMSCHSCHTEGHTAGLLVDTLGDGDYGAAKLVPSLLGTRDTQPWGWDGNTSLFRRQIQKSVTTTMHGEELAVRELEDLAAFLGSLNAPPPPDRADKELAKKGRSVFESRGCIDCHAPPAYTTPVTVDVGLQDELKRRQFNPPSLRGVSQRRRYFHDGRAESLEDVLQEVGHQLDEPLKETEFQALVAFLRSL